MSKHAVIVSPKKGSRFNYKLMRFCCDEFVLSHAKDGKEISAKCGAINTRPECSDCGLSNPNSPPKESPHLNTPLH